MSKEDLSNVGVSPLEELLDQFDNGWIDHGQARRMAAIVRVQREALERLTKAGPPSKPCSGAEVGFRLLEDNCNIATEALARANELASGKDSTDD